MRKHDPVLHLKDLRKWPHDTNHFQIKKIENTTAFKMENHISTSKVESLLDNGWKVVIS